VREQARGVLPSPHPRRWDLPTAQQVVLAYSDQMRLGHYFRAEDGWQLTVLTGPQQSLELEAVEFSMDLEQVYFDLDLPS
jgi:hypothetical protein